MPGICLDCRRANVLRAAKTHLCMGCARKRKVCVYCGEPSLTGDPHCSVCTPALQQLPQSATARIRRIRANSFSEFQYHGNVLDW